MGGLDLACATKEQLLEILEKVVRDERISESDIIDIFKSSFNSIELEFIAKGLTK